MYQTQKQMNLGLCAPYHESMEELKVKYSSFVHSLLSSLLKIQKWTALHLPSSRQSPLHGLHDHPLLPPFRPLLLDEG